MATYENILQSKVEMPPFFSKVRTRSELSWPLAFCNRFYRYAPTIGESGGDLGQCSYGRFLFVKYSSRCFGLAQNWKGNGWPTLLRVLKASNFTSDSHSVLHIRYVLLLLWSMLKRHPPRRESGCSVSFPPPFYWKNVVKASGSRQSYTRNETGRYDKLLIRVP